MKKSRYSTLLRCLLALVAVAGLMYWGADVHDRFKIGFHLDQITSDPFKIDADTGRVISVEPEAAHAGLVKDATVESLNGAPYTGAAQIADIENPSQPGDVLTVGFQRPDGSTGTARIILVVQKPDGGLPHSDARVWQQSPCST
jgi:hypothetical protein